MNAHPCLLHVVLCYGPHPLLCSLLLYSPSFYCCISTNWLGSCVTYTCEVMGTHLQWNSSHTCDILATHICRGGGGVVWSLTSQWELPLLTYGIRDHSPFIHSLFVRFLFFSPQPARLCILFGWLSVWDFFFFLSGLAPPQLLLLVGGQVIWSSPLFFDSIFFFSFSLEIYLLNFQ